MNWTRNAVLVIWTAFTAVSCELPVDSGRWTVMSWNVQNLFDGVDDGNEYPEFDPSSASWDARLYERRLERTGEVIKSCGGAGPDLIVLQELEKPEVLTALANGPLHRSDYRYLLAVPGYGIIRCGLMSRYPLVEVRVVDCGTWWDRSLRPLVAVTVLTPLGPVRVIACHWKSPRDGREATEEARRREAAAALELTREFRRYHTDIPVMIIGDLNTPGDGEVVPSALAPWDPHNGVSDTQAVLYRTPYRDGVGTDSWEDSVFFDPEPSVGPSGTYWFRSQWDRPDRALLSEGFINGKGLEFSSCRTAAVSVMGDSEGHPDRWISDFEEGYSDHFPLVLEFYHVD